MMLKLFCRFVDFLLIFYYELHILLFQNFLKTKICSFVESNGVCATDSVRIDG